MEVLLLKNIKGLGQRGEKKEVKDGYARNFLLPHVLAVAASAQNLMSVKRSEECRARREQKEKKEAKEAKAKHEGQTIKIRSRASEQGTLYAACGPVRVAEEFKRMGFDIAPEKIAMMPVKTAGASEVVVNFLPGVAARVFVQVIPE